MKKDGFVRDNSNPGAVINTDDGALQAYKLKKQKQKEVDMLRNEVSEIKTMLTMILEKMK